MIRVNLMVADVSVYERTRARREHGVMAVDRMIRARLRQRQYRLSEKGQAAAARQQEHMHVRRLARKIDHYRRRNRARAIHPLSTYGGPLPAGVPVYRSDCKLPSYAIARTMVSKEDGGLL